MTKIYRTLLMTVLILCSLTTLAQKASSPVHYTANQYQKGRLTSLQMDSLRAFLSANGTAARDTIIIRFDFNRDRCWNGISRSGAYIDKMIIREQSALDSLTVQRPKLSVYRFRDPGKKVANHIARNTTIRIDSTGLLQRLLFRENTVCGSSVLIAPSGLYLLVRSDEDFSALRLDTKKVMEAITR